MICEGGMMDGMPGGMWVAGLFWLLVIGGGVAVVVWAIVRGSRHGDVPAAGHEDRALALLRERFARGEITADEYREHRRVLDER